MRRKKKQAPQHARQSAAPAALAAISVHAAGATPSAAAPERRRPRILIFHLDGDTIAPACVRALRSLECQIDEVRLETLGIGGVRLVEPDSWEKVIALIVRRRSLAIFLLNSKGVDDEGNWLAVAELLRIPVFNWFTDHPRFCPLQSVETLSETLHLLLWDGAYVEEMRGQGYRHVHDLPLAGEPEAARKIAAAPLDPPCDVAFVGSLGDHRIAAMRQELREMSQRFGKPSPEEIEEWIAQGRAWARANRGKSIFQFTDAIDRERLPIAAMPHSGEDAARAARRLIASVADFENMREDRLGLARLLREKGMKVWGDIGWVTELAPGQFRGFIAYEEVGRVYRDAKIVVNLSRDQLASTVNQRVFDVPVAGGFLITDWRPNLPDFVEPGVDMAVYRDIEELPALIDRYVGDEAARKEMAARAAAKIAANHTYRHRMETVLALARQAAAQLAGRPPEPLHEEWEKRLSRVARALAVGGPGHSVETVFAIASEIERRGYGSPYGEICLAYADCVKVPQDLDRARERLIAICRAISDPQARHSLGQILTAQKRIEEIEPVILAVEESQRTSTDWQWLGAAHVARNQFRKAIYAFDYALELDPNNRTALEFLNRLTGQGEVNSG